VSSENLNSILSISIQRLLNGGYVLISLFINNIQIYSIAPIQWGLPKKAVVKNYCLFFKHLQRTESIHLSGVYPYFAFVLGVDYDCISKVTVALEISVATGALFRLYIDDAVAST
jgi:hypothetical protein